MRRTALAPGKLIRGQHTSCKALAKHLQSTCNATNKAYFPHTTAGDAHQRTYFVRPCFTPSRLCSSVLMEAPGPGLGPSAAGCRQHARGETVYMSFSACMPFAAMVEARREARSLQGIGSMTFFGNNGNRRLLLNNQWQTQLTVADKLGIAC